MRLTHSLPQSSGCFFLPQSPNFCPAGSTQRCGSCSVRRSLPAAFFSSLSCANAWPTIIDMTQRFTTSQWVPFPVEQVFAFFADPANLPRLMPGSLKTKVNATRLVPPTGNTDLAISSRWTAAGVGSEIDISFRPFPFVPYRVRWTARIAEFVWNDHFCDEQLRGPFASFRHCHVIHAEARQGVQGSLVDDEIEFRLPFGVLGQAAGLFVRLNLKTSFRQRQDQLLRMLSAEPKSANQP